MDKNPPAKRAIFQLQSKNSTKNVRPHISTISPNPVIPPDRNHSSDQLSPVQLDVSTVSPPVPSPPGLSNSTHSGNTGNINAIDSKQSEQSSTNQLPQNSGNNQYQMGNEIQKQLSDSKSSAELVSAITTAINTRTAPTINNNYTINSVASS